MTSGASFTSPSAPAPILPLLLAPTRTSTLLCRAADGGGPGQEEPHQSGRSPGPEDGSAASEVEQLRRKFFGSSAGDRPPSPATSRRASPPSSRRPSPTLTRSGSAGAADPDANPLDSVNPYALGRQARKAFDEVWTQISNLGSPTKSFILDDTLEPARDVEFAVPQSAYTTVLVVGATGRVGRILIRKLLLRGYAVRALVRPKRDDGNQRDEYTLPAAVEVVEGDLGDAELCQAAVRGCNKVIFCAAARSTFTADLIRVEERGVMNIVKALQDEFARQAHRDRQAAFPAEDQSPEAIRARRRLFSSRSKKEIADFSQRYHQIRWDVTFVGTPEERQAHSAVAAAAAVASGSGTRGGSRDSRDSRDGGEEDGERGDDASSSSSRAGREALLKPSVDRWMAASKVVAEITQEDHLIFTGALASRGVYAEVGAQLHPFLPGGEHRTANTEAVTLRVRGDGNTYALVLQTRQGHSYVARFPTRQGFLNVRLPYSFFRPEREGQPQLNPEHITFVALRYEAPRRPPTGPGAGAGKDSRVSASLRRQLEDQAGKFELEVDWIKATPSGDEPDVILVSSSRNARQLELPDSDVSRVIAAKRRGEENLRLSGLGYTIIRPGRLVEEPGGYKALVFDQGDRIDQPISAADVADICLRALHEPAARNKTFDVCYELPSDTGSSMYELVTSAPDKKGQYLGQAAAALAKNT